MNKKSAIKEMFWGNRGTYEQIPLSEEYKNSREEMYKAVDAFLEKLNKEEQELFDNAFVEIMSNNSEYAADHFVEGFKFGLSIGLEISESKEE